MTRKTLATIRPKTALIGILMAAILLVGSAVFAGCAQRSDDPAANEPQAAQGDTAEATTAFPSTAGALHVEGARLMSQSGEPVQLRGVSTHGLAWFPQYVNQELFDELHTDWNANVVRLSLYTAESEGYCTDGDREELEATVRKGVEYATNADLYAIIDWHVLSDQDPNKYLAQARTFFDEMSKTYAQSDNVIYEICNEPNGDTSWSQIRSYAEKVIPIIRANDPDALILVGTPQWCQRPEDVLDDRLDDENIMYTLHFYATSHQQELRDSLEKAVNAGLPIFVSEFGITEASGDGKIDYDSADAWIDLMDQLNVSYICWNLSNKDETSALFKPDCTKTSGFSEEDLSTEGKWLWDVLHDEGTASPEE